MEICFNRKKYFSVLIKNLVSPRSVLVMLKVEQADIRAPDRQTCVHLTYAV